MTQLQKYYSAIPFIYQRGKYLLAVLFLLCAFQLPAQKSAVTLNYDNASIEQVLNAIESQTDYHFLFNKQQVDVARKVSIKVSNRDVKSALSTLFSNTDIDYSIEGKQIVLKKRGERVESSKSIKVSGTVKNDKNEPVIGGGVLVKGTSRGTTTDVNGRFEIDAPANAVLTISYIGYVTQNIQVQNRSSFDIVLQEDRRNLDEVVVVGYGTQKKVSLTAAVTTISTDNLLKSPSASISNALTGVSPGLVYNNRSGKPGYDDALMLIRGYNTFASGSTGVGPLIVVDGIPDRNMNRIDPNDVESISLLKDASAAIYGVRAANGVILITTKRGKAGRVNVTYDASVSAQHLTRIAPRVNSWQYMQYYNEYALIKGSAIPYSIDDINAYKAGNDPNYTSTDWTTSVFRNWAPQTSHSLSVNGGTDAIKFNISGQYLKQMSNYQNSDLSYQNANVRSNIDVKANKYMKINLDLSAMREDSKNPVASDASIMHEMVNIYPWIPVYWTNGLPSSGISNGRNPVIMSSSQPGYNNITYYTVNSKAGMEIQLPFVTKGLYLSGYGSCDFITTFTKTFQRPWHAYSYNLTTDTYSDQYSSTLLSQLSQTNSISNEYTLFGKLGYSRQFGNHNVDAFAAYEQTTYRYDYTTATRDKLISNELDQLFTGTKDDNTDGTGSAAQWGRASVFGRINYDYKSKYLAEVILRYNGSYNFDNGRKWGLFPSISAGWRISEENFFKPLLPYIDNLKLRASWGILGSDAVSQYYYLAKYGIETNYEWLTYFGNNYDQALSIYNSSVPNKKITWEKQDTRNVGLDASLLNGQFSVTLDLFRNYRSDILAKRQASIPLYTGLSLPYENIGKCLNQGFEFDIRYHQTKTKLQYHIGFNLSYHRSKILYEDEAANIPSWQRYTGSTVDSWLIYKTNGIYHTQDEVNNSPHLAGAGPGDIWIKDIDGDGKISSKDMVRVNKGVKPRITFGLPISFAYRHWGLSFTFGGQALAWIQIRPQAQGSAVVPPKWVYEKRFISSTETPNAEFPRATASGDSRNNLDAEVYLRNASFVKLRNAELSYTFDKKLLSKTGFLENVRLYLNASNLFSLDGLKDYGVDPETNSLTGVSYPQTRIIRFGINVGL